MTEEVVKYETAKLAKEKGFNAPSHYYYAKSKTFVHHSPYNQLYLLDIAAPIQSLLQKWLREEHNCIVEVTFYSENIESIKDIKYEVEIDYYGKDFHNIGDSSDYQSNGYDTYEKALEVGLFEGLKLIK